MRFFFTYVYARVLNTPKWTSLRVLSTPYVYVRKKKRITGKQPYPQPITLLKPNRNSYDNNALFKK